MTAYDSVARGIRRNRRRYRWRGRARSALVLLAYGLFSAAGYLAATVIVDAARTDPIVITIQVAPTTTSTTTGGGG